MTNPMLPATMTVLRKLVDDIFVQLDGIPEDDLNTWLPRDGMRDVNTFYALATHTVGAGEFWIVDAAGRRAGDRDRLAEFRANGTLAGRCGRGPVDHRRRGACLGLFPSGQSGEGYGGSAPHPG